MPELPEVETVARELNQSVRGAEIRRVSVLDEKLFHLKRAKLSGSQIQSVYRIGKFVVWNLVREGADPACLATHLRMTGRFHVARATADAPERARVRFDTSMGKVYFVDVRRFGTINYYNSPEEIPVRGLDPTTDAFTIARLRELLGSSSQELKAWLLRQDKLVGIGNIYASEILFRAKLSPFRAAGTLSGAEVKRLHSATVAVLDEAIENCGTTFSDFARSTGLTGSYQQYLGVYQQAGAPCPSCKASIERAVQQQRSTFYCSNCQGVRAPK